MVVCCTSIPIWISLVLILFATTLNLASFSAPSWAVGFNTSGSSRNRRSGSLQGEDKSHDTDSNLDSLIHSDEHNALDEFTVFDLKHRQRRHIGDTVGTSGSKFITVYVGLWTYCSKGKCSQMKKALTPAWLNLVQLLVCLSLMFSLASSAISVLTTFMNNFKGPRTTQYLTIFIAMSEIWILAAVSTFAGIINKKGILGLKHISFSYSFHMSIVSIVTMLVAMVLLCFQSYTVYVTDDDVIELQNRDRSEYQDLDKN